MAKMRDHIFGETKKFALMDIGLEKHKTGWSLFGFGIGKNKGYNGWKTNGSLGFKSLAGGAASNLVFPAFNATIVYNDYKENGLGSAAMTYGVNSLIGGGINTMFRGTGKAIGMAWRDKSLMPISKMAKLAGKRGAALAGEYAFLAPLLAWEQGMEYSINKAQARNASYMDMRHRSLGVGTAGSLAAFQTKGAWTSRQMAVQAIQKSHLNARSALGNEAMYLHR